MQVHTQDVSTAAVQRRAERGCGSPEIGLTVCSLLQKIVAMTKGRSLGELEQLVLLAVLRLKGDAYGMAIRREIESRCGRDVAIGAVYSALDRMERKGYVTSSMGSPSPTPGGRARRFFSVRDEGLAALRTSLRGIRGLLEGLDPDLRLG